MASLIHTIKTKGAVKTLRRMGMIYARYSFNRLVISLRMMMDTIYKYDACITLPITAITLDRHIDTIKEFKSKRIEWAMHGYIHVDYAKLGVKEIKDHIKKGIEIFKRAGIKLHGFRAPYLSIDQRVISVLKQHGFLYDSSKSFFVESISPDHRDIKLILEYYKPMKTWKMGDIGGIMEIPVCLPDDEMLVDRMGYRGEKIGKIWIDMCEKIKNLGGIPVLQLHPERGTICQSALEMVLQWATKNDFKPLTLRDITKEETNNAIAITGDIDIIKISDFRYMMGGI